MVMDDIEVKTVKDPYDHVGNKIKLMDNSTTTLEMSSTWASKIVMHRGWHRLSNEDKSRPMENTREAYIQAAELGAAYAECDVWVTRDGKMVLCHNSTFESMVSAAFAVTHAKDVCTPIEELDWTTIMDFQLLDESKPVLLSTVLSDLKSTNTRLAVELKCSRLALPLAKYLLQNPELVSTVGFVMGFAADSVIIFRGVVNNHPVLGKIKVLYLVDNPSEGYNVEDLDEGETTFNFLESNVTSFLQAQAFTPFLLSVGFHGLYIQYRPGLTPSHVLSIRQELATMLGASSCDDVFVGIWSDKGLDPDFDTPESLKRWAAVCDGLNTDCAFMGTMSDVPSILSES